MTFVTLGSLVTVLAVLFFVIWWRDGLEVAIPVMGITLGVLSLSAAVVFGFMALGSWMGLV